MRLKPFDRISLAVFFACFTIVAPLHRATAAPTPVTDEETANIKTAIPDSPRVKPNQPRKILVFSLARGFVHDSIPVGARCFQLLGEQTGAYEALLSEDIALFEPEAIRQFDAILMNNTTGELFRPADFDQLDESGKQAALDRESRLKKSLLEFVRGGKGLIGFHAATDAFYEWPEYGAMIGGYFDGHPWTEEVSIKLDSPSHPLLAAFKEDFKVRDEIYQFRDPYSRERLTVLLKLDPDKVDMTKDGIHRQDKDFAVSWIRAEGKGRVFYCSLGHMRDIYWNPALLPYFLDGIQYALGDLPLEDEGSAQASKQPADAPRHP